MPIKKVYEIVEFYNDELEKCISNIKKDFPQMKATNICKKVEWLYKRDEEIKKYCISENKNKLIIYSPSIKNYTPVLGWISNLDFSLGPVEKIKARAKKYEFINNKELIILKTEDGNIVFDSSKSFSSKMVISYLQESERLTEEIIYGTHKKVKGIYLPFFVSDAHFKENQDELENDFYLVDKYIIGDIKDGNFEIKVSTDTEIINESNK